MQKPIAIWRALPQAVQWLLLALVAIQLALIAIHLIAYFATLGDANAKGERKWLDFNQEGSVQTFWSAAVMFAAGVAAFEAGRGGGQAERRSFPWLLTGLGFVWLGAEELVHLHEDLQVASGIDWPFIYLPALLIGCWVIVHATVELEAVLRSLLLVGLACLAVAVGAELLSSPSISIDFNLRNLVEENLELLGATLALIASLAHGQRERRSEEARYHSPRTVLGGDVAEP